MTSSSEDSARISPTAYYTGHVWCRHGLSPAALDTREGAVLFQLARPLMRVARRFTGGVTLEDMLLQRHRVLDHLLGNAIEDGRIGQVVEIAAGMSGRGVRFAKRFDSLIYVEADLPAMAARKRRVLRSAGLESARHHVVTLDVLRDEGPDSLPEATRELLDPKRGTAIVTEGLLNYFDKTAVTGMWRRFARLLSRYPHDLYLADVHLEGSVAHVPAVRGFRRMLELFTRGRTHLHFHDADEVTDGLRANGFATARVHRPREHAGVLEIPALGGPDVVHLIEASTR